MFSSSFLSILPSLRESTTFPTVSSILSWSTGFLITALSMFLKKEPKPLLGLGSSFGCSMIGGGGGGSTTGVGETSGSIGEGSSGKVSG